MEFYRGNRINFLGKKKIAFALSGGIILIGIIFFIIHGGFNFNIDFTGGYLLELSFGKAVDVGAVRSVVENMGIKNPVIQSVGGNNSAILMRFQGSGKDDMNSVLLKKLKERFEPDGYTISILRAENVGPKIGKELQGKAIWAVVFALIGILLYVWFRFQLRFGVASVVALMHDVLVTLSIFVIFNREISLDVVAALLTIVGYSINDSIVISDRIRENMKILFRKKFPELVNTSLNQVFSRTIVTSLTTFVVVLSIFLFGGSVIHNFSLALLIGVVVGTYSSIFIVSPVVVEWEKSKPQKLK